MHGAAQTPKAPPKKRAGAALPGPLDELGRRHSVEPREGQQPHECEAENHDDQTCNHPEQLGVVEKPPRGARETSKHHEDRGEACDERDAGDGDALPAHSNLCSRDGR
jgi:hypothetical protein